MLYVPLKKISTENKKKLNLKGFLQLLLYLLARKKCKWTILFGFTLKVSLKSVSDYKNCRKKFCILGC